MLVYHRNDTRPHWELTAPVNGQLEDLSTGFTFLARIQIADQAPLLSKATEITGGADGAVTVAWESGDLDLEPGRYKVLLTTTRTSDSGAWTISDTIRILGS